MTGTVSSSGDATARWSSGFDTVALTGKFVAIPGGATCSGTLTATSAGVAYSGTWNGHRDSGANPFAGRLTGTGTVQTPFGTEHDTFAGTVAANGTVSMLVTSPSGTYSGTGVATPDGKCSLVVIITYYGNYYCYGTLSLTGTSVTGWGRVQLWTGGQGPSFTGYWTFTGQKT